MPTLRSVETKSPVHAAIVENLRNIQRYSGETASLICASRWEDAQLRCDWVKRLANQMWEDIERIRA